MRKLLLAVVVLSAVAVGAQATTYQRGESVRVQDMEMPSVLKIVGVSKLEACESPGGLKAFRPARLNAEPDSHTCSDEGARYNRPH